MSSSLPYGKLRPSDDVTSTRPYWPGFTHSADVLYIPSPSPFQQHFSRWTQVIQSRLVSSSTYSRKECLGISDASFLRAGCPSCHQTTGKKERKSIYVAPFYIICISQSAQSWITQFYLQIHHACLSFVSAHQMAPPLTHIEGIQLQLTTHLLTPNGWKAEMAWLVELYRTINLHKWSFLSYRSSAGQKKFAGHRPTFYCCAMQPTNQQRLITKRYTKHWPQSLVSFILSSATMGPVSKRC